MRYVNIILSILIFCFFTSCKKEEFSTKEKSLEYLKIEYWINCLCSTSLGGRYYGSVGGDNAAKFIKDAINDYNTQIIQIPNVYNISGMQNVICEIPGLVDSTVVIGAHYDSYGYSQGFYSPGADDNASGVAVLLATIDKLRFIGTPYYTLKFCFWDGEEFGRYGSKYFLEYNGSLDKIVMYINVDTCGRSDEYDLSLLYDKNYPALKNIFADCDSINLLNKSEYSPLGFTTDCEYFREYEIPYAHIGCNKAPSYAHKSIDISADIDINQLIAISDILSKFINTFCYD